jgi:hypothetical protein
LVLGTTPGGYRTADITTLATVAGDLYRWSAGPTAGALAIVLAVLGLKLRLAFVTHDPRCMC